MSYEKLKKKFQLTHSYFPTMRGNQNRKTPNEPKSSTVTVRQESRKSKRNTTSPCTAARSSRRL